MDTLFATDALRRYRNDSVIRFFCQRWQLPHLEGDLLFQETKRWLWLCARRPEILAFQPAVPFVAMRLVDEMWQCFVLDTDGYASFCKDVLESWVPYRPFVDRRIHGLNETPEAARDAERKRLVAQRTIVVEELGKEVLRLWTAGLAERYPDDFLKRLWDRSLLMPAKRPPKPPLAREGSSFSRLIERLETMPERRDATFEQALEAAREALVAVLDDAEWLERYATSFLGSTERYPLAFGCQRDYSVHAQVFAGHAASDLHDHKTWGLIGVWQGEEREERFMVADDGSIRPAETLVNPAGTAVRLLDPDEDIHRVCNPHANPAYSLHIYGRPPGQGSEQFDAVSLQRRRYLHQAREQLDTTADTGASG